MRVLKFLDYLWRLFATALSFSVFGIGGLIMGLLIFPLMFVFLRNSERRKFVARRWIGKAFGGFWEMMNVLGVLDYRIEGLEHIDSRGNQLVVANHPTLIDVVLLISVFPRANCVIKKAVTKNIFMRSVVQAADYVSNSEPEELLGSCVSYMSGGGSLLLFPEGTRTRQGQPIDFRPGAATVAMRAGVDVLPVAIECKPLFLSKELPWYFVPEERPVFTIRILAPLSASDFVLAEASERHARQDLNDRLWSLITEELTSMEFSEKANYNT